jgi:hypothetical protein
MQPTHNGVLVPEELNGATSAELDAYADRVKAGNRAFITAVFAVEDRAAELGVELDR